MKWDMHSMIKVPYTTGMGRCVIGGQTKISLSFEHSQRSWKRNTTNLVQAMD